MIYKLTQLMGVFVLITAVFGFIVPPLVSSDTISALLGVVITLSTIVGVAFIVINVIFKDKGE